MKKILSLAAAALGSVNRYLIAALASLTAPGKARGVYLVTPNERRATPHGAVRGPTRRDGASGAQDFVVTEGNAIGAPSLEYVKYTALGASRPEPRLLLIWVGASLIVRRSELGVSMRCVIRRGMVAAIFATAVLAVAQAHHSVAMFDLDKRVIIKGSMKSISFLNPHVWISVIGSPDGKGDALQWDIEATSPMLLTQIGIQKDTLTPGDKVTVVMHPLRDGRRAGSFMLIATADGRTFGANPVELKLAPADLTP